METTTLRLLHRGLPDRAALPWSPAALAASPLGGDRPPERALWRERAGWLERPWPGLPAPLYLAGTATSCLDVAHALARQGSLPEWGGVLVERQTHGRGQLARRWESPPGNVYAALRLPLAYPLDTAAAAPALGGLTAEALRRMGYAVWCKWPNDILQVIHEEINDGEQGNAAVRPGNVWRKVGGILLEERGGALIAGMGFNLAGSPGASLLRKKFSFPAGCLEAPTPEKTPASLIAWWIRLAGEIFSCYSSPIVAASDVFWWPALAEKHLAFRGSLVRVCDTAPDSAQEGILEGLCASGALRLRTASGSMTFSGGTVVPVTSAEGVRGA